APGQLGDPWPDGAVVPEAPQLLVDLGEDVLEDVFGVLLRESEALDADRVHVAGEPLHQLVPGVGIPCATPRDERLVGLTGRPQHRLSLCWPGGRNQPRRAPAGGPEPRYAARSAARAGHAGRPALPADPL